MANCPNCNATINFYQTTQLVTIKNKIKCNSCGSELKINNMKMFPLLIFIYLVSIFPGVYLYEENISFNSVIIFVIWLFVAMIIL